jgi:hypothetical protein
MLVSADWPAAGPLQLALSVAANGVKGQSLTLGCVQHVVFTRKCVRKAAGRGLPCMGFSSLRENFCMLIKNRIDVDMPPFLLFVKRNVIYSLLESANAELSR